MESARFTYHRTESGWRMKTDEPGLEGPLEGVFRYELRLDQVPVALPLVGHCRVLGLWCVFFRSGDSTTLSGAALRPDAYAVFGFDPFAAAAGLLGSDLTAAAGGEPIAQPRAAEGRGPEYLPAAYRFFLSGDTTARQSLYCSVLPEGCPRRISPLTCFLLEGDRLVADGLVERLEEGSAEAAPAGASSRPAAPVAPPLPHPADGCRVPATEAPVPGRAPAAGATTERDAEPARDLAAELDAALDRLAATERRLVLRTRRLAAALVAAAVLFAAAVAVDFWWTRRQVQRLEALHAQPPGTTTSSP